MNTHDKIELPAEFRSGNSVPVTVATIKRERMEEILIAAIEAYRKQMNSEWRWCEPGDDITDLVEIKKKGTGTICVIANTHGIARKLDTGQLEFRGIKSPREIRDHYIEIKGVDGIAEGYRLAGFVLTHKADGTRNDEGVIKENLYAVELPPLPAISVMGKLSPEVWFTASELDALRKASIEADRQQRHLEEKAQLEQERSILKRMQAQYEALRKYRGEPVAVVLPGEDGDYINPIPGKPLKTGDILYNAPQLTDPRMGEPVDKGPWKAGVNSIDARVFLGSDDFTHDVRLYIDGDFANQGEKLDYAKSIADQLNTAPQPAEPVKMPSDSAIMFEWSQTPNTGDMRVDLIAFARAILARYG